ncbi:putative cytokinetic ring protein SteA [Desulfitibacter alkalitolerans]|uniref:putative cytokinetic ring protein SteA n=1 Tax=Desulfitibacter alkalitolerans TaxID=264641 RepID=UPI000484769C|nr:putative cytokinetic ring protein SteA [Desulfitibacter alkalitolerans]
MKNTIKGRVLKNRRTKELVPNLKPGDIALIAHEDLDEIAANSLIEAKVKAVINVKRSSTGKYPNPGPLNLLEKGIAIIECVNDEIWDTVDDGDEISIIGGTIYNSSGGHLTQGKLLNLQGVKAALKKAKENFNPQLEKFIKNTIEYAKSELEVIFKEIDLSHIQTAFKGKHCLIVVRGQKYKEDLQALRSYIREMKPVLIGVDGGADALLENGLKPNLIIGDMDSVSDKALKCGAEIVVHAYRNGKAPGIDRMKNLGISNYKVLPTFGTSEDVAMLVAYEKGAELIVAVGTHSNVIDFLEKGRQGMSSTFLVRLKIGSILMDARGVNQLYKQKFKLKYFAAMVMAALIPLFIVFIISPPAFQFVRLLYLRLRLILQV